MQLLRQAQHSFSTQMSYAVHPELVEGTGEVPVTYADTTPFEEDFGYKTSSSLHTCLHAFAEWYAKY